MAKTHSWLPRLKEIRDSVAGSVRSHYTRAEIEQLFQIQKRSATGLIALLPTVPIGTGPLAPKLVAREELSKFLDRIAAADDVPAEMDKIVAEKAKPVRKKLRYLMRRDLEALTVGALPSSIEMSPGRMVVSFENEHQLAESLFTLARVLTDDLEQFAQQWRPRKITAEPDAEAQDVQQLFSELEELERESVQGSGARAAHTHQEPRQA